MPEAVAIFFIAVGWHAVRDWVLFYFWHPCDSVYGEIRLLRPLKVVHLRLAVKPFDFVLPGGLRRVNNSFKRDASRSA